MGALFTGLLAIRALLIGVYIGLSCSPKGVKSTFEVRLRAGRCRSLAKSARGPALEAAAQTSHSGKANEMSKSNQERLGVLDRYPIHRPFGYYKYTQPVLGTPHGTQRVPVPNIEGLCHKQLIPFMVFGITNLKNCVLGPSQKGACMRGNNRACKAWPVRLGQDQCRLRQASSSGVQEEQHPQKSLGACKTEGKQEGR